MRRLSLAAALLFVLVGGVLPLAVMIVASLRQGDSWSVTHYLETLSTERQWLLLGRSLVLSSLVSVAATVIGVAVALMVERTDMPGSRLIVGLLALPLVLPPYVVAVGWFEVLGRQGYLSALAGDAIAAWTSHRLFGLPGCLLALTGSYIAVPLLVTMAYLRGVNASLEEAGRLVRPPFAVLRRLTLPLVQPGLFLAVILVFLLTLGELGVTTFLRYDVFPVSTLVQFSAFYDFGAAAATCTPLVLVTVALVLSERARTGEACVRVPAGAEVEDDHSPGKAQVAGFRSQPFRGRRPRACTPGWSHGDRIPPEFTATRLVSRGCELVEEPRFRRHSGHAHHRGGIRTGHLSGP